MLDKLEGEQVKIKITGKKETPAGKEKLKNSPLGQKEKKSLPIIKPAQRILAWTAKRLAVLLVFLIVSITFFSTQIPISGQSSVPWFKRISIVNPLKHLVESANKKLKGEDRDRINILLLGMGGKNHSGGYLTDTIILASIKPSAKKIALLSIPRDLVVPIEGYGWQKINHINAYAEVKNKGSGGLAVSQAIGDILGIPIDYYVRLDFAGFIKIIDAIGGVKVYVDNTLDDYHYPIMGREEAEPYESRFEHLHIDKGWQTMDGDLALKYARSRHALGAEGSDFARARRQQKILEAVKDKVLSFKMLLKPLAIKKSLQALHDHVSTNLKIWEMLRLWEITKGIDKKNIINKVLDNSPNGLLVSGTSEDGAYILQPRSGDFTEIQYLVKNIFSDAPLNTKHKIITEAVKIDIKNGTWVNGLASQVALDLEKYGFEVLRVSNCSRRNFSQSVIYDLTYGDKLDSLRILKDKMQAKVSFGLPGWLAEEIKKEVGTKTNIKQPDFILILGENAAEKK